ncbi:D-arabinitol 2-dehydrogenase [Escovopsis weberi]|uniref:D-arabinitol 2-dehydrogenase n=1 Tax=Escovopsis weberi TaxID=150374 RepID=A0A0M8NAE0_ESCWE|nr:D-arabinitol 2-dehydrogenase [Escovopsis weberi]
MRSLWFPVLLLLVEGLVAASLPAALSSSPFFSALPLPLITALLPFFSLLLLLDSTLAHLLSSLAGLELDDLAASPSPLFPKSLLLSPGYPLLPSTPSLTMSRFAPRLSFLARQRSLAAVSPAPRSALLATSPASSSPSACARPIHTTLPRPSSSSSAVAAAAVEPASQSNLLPEFSLKDKVIVISGGGGGLGLVQAEALLEAGAKVYCIDIVKSPAEDPNSEFSRIARRAREELGTSLSYQQMDVRDAESVNKAMEGIAHENGRLDGLVAAAGINFECPALEYPPEEVDRVLSINVSGVFLTAQAAARQMIRLKQPGSILLIASMSGTVANRGMFAPIYNTSKGGVVQMGRSLAAEWGQYGIRVNTLSPGYILTKMLIMLFDDYPERKDKWPKENMLGRFSLPKEYRGAAVFLLSDASSFMTGSDLRIDGGHAAW